MEMMILVRRKRKKRKRKKPTSAEHCLYVRCSSGIFAIVQGPRFAQMKHVGPRELVTSLRSSNFSAARSSLTPPSPLVLQV